MFSIDSEITQLEQRIKDLQDLRASLIAKREALRALPSDVTSKKLAVFLHQIMCTKSHSSPLECEWHDECADPNDPELCDWARTQHTFWLQRAALGISGLSDIGLEIKEVE